MKSLIRVAQELQSFFEEKSWKFCFIGGLALQRWGNPRLTQDVDVTLLTGFGEEENFINTLLSKYSSRVPDPVQFAMSNRVLLLQSGQVGIDIALAGLPFEEEITRRSTLFEYLPGIFLMTCSAEDLLIMKAFANRTQDWADIESILERQRSLLDFSHVENYLKPLCELKEAPEIWVRLESLIRRR